MNRKEWVWTLGIILFVIGAFLRSGTALHPIHEFMHVIYAASEGVEPLAVKHSEVIFKADDITASIIYNGYYGELMLYGFLTFVFAIIYRPIAAFFLGLLHVIAFEGYYSYDFNVLAMQYFNDRQIIEANLSRWLIVCAVVLIGLWVMVLRKNAHNGT